MATKDEREIEAGKQALRRVYHESMRSFAREILEGAKGEGYSNADDAHEWMTEQVHQTADGTSWVIYTHAALDTLVASDNWDAIDDYGTEFGDSMTTVVTQAAYAAVEADLWEYIRAFEDEYFTEENPRRKSSKARGGKKGGLKSKLLR